MKQPWSRIEVVGRASLLRALVVAGVVASTGGACTGAGSSADPSADAAPSEHLKIAMVEWRLVHLVDDAGAWHIPEDLDPVMRFDGRGRFSGKGCNLFKGRATIGPDRISDVGEVSWTEVACRRPGEIRVDAALDAAVPGSWTLDQEALVIRSDEGVTLTFRNGPEGAGPIGWGRRPH